MGTNALLECCEPVARSAHNPPLQSDGASVATLPRAPVAERQYRWAGGRDTIQRDEGEGVQTNWRGCSRLCGGVRYNWVGPGRANAASDISYHRSWRCHRCGEGRVVSNHRLANRYLS